MDKVVKISIEIDERIVDFLTGLAKFLKKEDVERFLKDWCEDAVYSTTESRVASPESLFQPGQLEEVWDLRELFDC